MRKRAVVFAVAGLALCAISAALLQPLFSSPDVPTLDIGKDFPARNARDEEAGLCPWRNPEADRKHFFAAATYTREETLILSRQRSLIARQLGRQPTGQENALQIHRCLWHDAAGEHLAGTILTRCVSGESGLIELVLAVDKLGRIRGARLQRLREPDAVARELQAARFLNALKGKTFASNWKADRNLTAVSAAAQVSAAALVEGVRSAMILLQAGEQLNKHFVEHP